MASEKLPFAIEDFVEEALKGIVEYGDNFMIDKGRGSDEGKSCDVMYSRHAKGGTYQCVADVACYDCCIVMIVNKYSKSAREVLSVELADPNCSKKLGQAILDIISTMQLDRRSHRYDNGPGIIRR